MGYKISISPRAQKEIEDAIDYYLFNSELAPKEFIKSLIEAYYVISKNPFYKICYKNIRSVQLRKFPYSLFYVISEENKSIKILACFHNKQNPNKRPK